MTGHVRKKRDRWYVVLEFGYQPSRRCPSCRRTTWTWETGELACEKCGATLEPSVERRRQQCHGSWTRRADARAELTNLLGNVQKGTYVPPAPQTFAEFIERTWLPALQVRPSTAYSYTRNLRTHVLPAIGAMQIQAVDAAALNRLYRQLLTDGNRGPCRPGSVASDGPLPPHDHPPGTA